MDDSANNSRNEQWLPCVGMDGNNDILGAIAEIPLKRVLSEIVGIVADISGIFNEEVVGPLVIIASGISQFGNKNMALLSKEERLGRVG